MLANMLKRNHVEIVARARLRAAQRRAPGADDEQLEHGIPLLLRRLATMMSGTHADLETLDRTAVLHGDELLRSGFSVAQVIRGYGDIYQVVAEVAHELEVPIRAEELRVFNCCLDEAIAQVLTEYARLHELSMAPKSIEPMAVFAHELRNLMSGAALAFDTIRDGHVPSSGKTAALLGRSLRRMRELLDRSHPHPRAIRTAEVMESGATAEAKSRELQLVVHEVPSDI